jgi:hypothetical protein
VAEVYKLTHALMKALDFTPDELALNRTGLLSERQRKQHPIRWHTPTTANELITTLFIEKPIWWIDGWLCRALKKEVHSVVGAVKVNRYDLSVGELTISTNSMVIESLEDGAMYQLYYVFRPFIYLPITPQPRLISGEVL